MRIPEWLDAGGGAQRGVLGHGSPGPEQGGRLVAALEGKVDEPQWLDELLEHRSLADRLPGWSWGLSSKGPNAIRPNAIRRDNGTWKRCWSNKITG